jgi:hypothetical protein
VCFLLLFASCPLLGAAVPDAELQEVRHQSAALAAGGGLRGVGVHAEFEVREYLRSRSPAWSERALARLQGIADAYRDQRSAAQVAKQMDGWFFERYPFQFSCRALEREHLLPDDLKLALAPLREVPEASLKQLGDHERGVNNRAFNFSGDALTQALNHPDDPRAADFRRYAEVCWQDWIDLGSTPEVMPSYNRLFLAAILGLAELLGKEDELRGRMSGEFKRYFQQVSGNGVRGGEAEAMRSLIGAQDPGIKVPGWYGLDDIYSDPWAANCTLQFVDIAIRAARVFRDPEYIWYARTIMANGDVPDERLRPEAQAAIAERLGEFARDATAMGVPQDRSFVSRLDFRSGPIVDRLILMPQRAGTGPFAAFYLYDRLEGFMHGAVNQTGRLYEFSMDGSLLLRQGGKYSSKPEWENTIMMREPWKAFPTPSSGDVRGGRWSTATASLLAGRSRWEGDDEYRFSAGEAMPFAKATNPLPAHRLWGNYNVFTRTGDASLSAFRFLFSLIPTSGSVSGMDLTSLENKGMDAPAVLVIENVRLIGPKGEKTVDDLGTLRDAVGMTYTEPTSDKARFNKKFTHHPLLGADRSAVVEVVDGSRPGTHAWRIALKPGTTAITFPALAGRFDLTKDFTRIALDYRYECDTSGWTVLPIGFGAAATQWDGAMFEGSQGALLQSARTAQQGGDSLGVMEFGNVWTAGSRWKRQALMTREGVMLVCDEVVADGTADAWNAGPLWHVAPDWKNDKTGEKPLVGENWFDAPSFNRSVWQKAPKRLMVWFRAGPGRTTGMAPQDTAWYASYAVWQKAALTAGRPVRFVSLLVPHDAALGPAELSRMITVDEDAAGVITLSFGAMKAVMSPDDRWSVTR